MSKLIELQARSMGHALDVSSPFVGVVHSVFARAVNFEIHGDLWTLLAADQSDLPFGIRTTRKDFDSLALHSGDPVNVRSGFVGVRSNTTHLVVDCRAAHRWMPAVANKCEIGLVDRLAVVSSAARDRSWRGSAGMAHAVMSALHNPNALGDVLAGVVGCGPGLTPSGDDVLVGILAVLTSPHAGAEGAAAAESISRLIRPLLPTTTSVSGHLLRQATDGLFGRALHELVSAVIGDSTPHQLQDAIRRVIETGATSGADTCQGLLEFAPLFFIQQEERAAA